MAVDSSLPQISALRHKVTRIFAKELKVHSDFALLSDDIFAKIKIYVSQTTLERVWNYSTRGYSNISHSTLNILSRYAGYENWDAFCQELGKNIESGMFDEESINTSSLEPGQRIKLGWLPDRVCIIRYEGNNMFIVESSENTSVQPGDRFSCLQFFLHKPLYLTDFTKKDNSNTDTTYVVGRVNGLRTLSLLR